MQMQVSDSVERPMKSQKPVFLACSSVSQQLEQKENMHNKLSAFHIVPGENLYVSFSKQTCIAISSILLTIGTSPELSTPTLLT